MKHRLIEENSIISYNITMILLMLLSLSLQLKTVSLMSQIEKALLTKEDTRKLYDICKTLIVSFATTEKLLNYKETINQEFSKNDHLNKEEIIARLNQLPLSIDLFSTMEHPLQTQYFSQNNTYYFRNFDSELSFQEKVELSKLINDEKIELSKLINEEEAKFKKLTDEEKSLLIQNTPNPFDEFFKRIEGK